MTEKNHALQEGDDSQSLDHIEQPPIRVTRENLDLALKILREVLDENNSHSLQREGSPPYAGPVTHHDTEGARKVPKKRPRK